MATLGKINGSVIKLTVDGNPIGHITDFSIDASVNTPDASSADDGGHADFIYGKRTSTVSFNSLLVYDDDTDAGKTGFFDLYNSGYLGRTVFTLVMGTEEAGDSIITQDALLTSLSMNPTHDETVSYSGSFQMKGTPVVTQNV